MCPPQLFSKQDVPQDYAFRSYYGSDPDSFKAGVHKQPQSQARAMLLLPKPPTERVPVQDQSRAISSRLWQSSTVHAGVQAQQTSCEALRMCGPRYQASWSKKGFGACLGDSLRLQRQHKHTCEGWLTV